MRMRLRALQTIILVSLLLLVAAKGVRAQTTVVGGDLFVAQQGPVSATLLSDAGLSPYSLTLYWNSVFGMQVNNQQDKFGASVLFQDSTITNQPNSTVGSTVVVQITPPPPDITNGMQPASTYPQGIPLQLVLREP